MARKSKDNSSFEIAFYEKVLGYAPNFIEALVCLGDLYTKEGFYSQGLAVDERLAALRPDEPVVFYNLACSYSLLSDISAARRAMLRAIDLGYDEWDHLLKDADLANLLGDSEFMARLSEHRMKTGRKRSPFLGSFQGEAA